MPKLAQVATARQAQLQDGRRLGFAEYGDPDGAPLFLFHDLWGNHSLRHPDDSILTRLGIRLIGVDRPGFGMSTRKPGRGIMDVVDDVMLLSKALKLERFAVLGYSAGGPYALACAYRFPQIVKHCAVVSCLPPLDHEQGFRALHPFYGRLFQMASGNEPLFRLLIRGFFWFDAQRSADQYIRELGSSFSRADQEVLSNIDLFSRRQEMWSTNRRAGSDNLVDEIVSLTRSWGFHLESIRVPVDVWWGETDLFCSPIVGERMAKLIPNAIAHCHSHAGHLILFSHWEAIMQALITD